MWTDHVFTKSECLTWIPPSFSSKFRIKIALIIHLIICVDAQLSKKAQKVDALDGVHQMSHVSTVWYYFTMNCWVWVAGIVYVGW